MNVWLIAATVLVAVQLVTGWLIFRHSAGTALVALELASSTIVLVLMMLAEGFARSPFFDLALVLMPLSFGGGLTLARALERWV